MRPLGRSKNSIFTNFSHARTDSWRQTHTYVPRYFVLARSPEASRCVAANAGRAMSKIVKFDQRLANLDLNNCRNLNFARSNLFFNGFSKIIRYFLIEINSQKSFILPKIARYWTASCVTCHGNLCGRISQVTWLSPRRYVTNTGAIGSKSC